MIFIVFFLHFRWLSFRPHFHFSRFLFCLIFHFFVFLICFRYFNVFFLNFNFFLDFHFFRLFHFFSWFPFLSCFFSFFFLKQITFMFNKKKHEKTRQSENREFSWIFTKFFFHIFKSSFFQWSEVFSSKRMLRTSRRSHLWSQSEIIAKRCSPQIPPTTPAKAKTFQLERQWADTEAEHQARVVKLRIRAYPGKFRKI